MIGEVLAGRRAWAVSEADALALLAELPEASVDAVITDPPYALSFMGASWDTFGPDQASALAARKARKQTAVPPGHGGDIASPAEVDRSPGGLQGYQCWCECWAREALRVLKPGGHLVAFGGTRTHHRLWSALEDAGFEIRDTLMWLHGEGFPKSRDVSKAIDAEAGAEREVLGQGPFAPRRPRADHQAQGVIFADDAYVRPPGDVLTAPVTEEARRWAGWGTGLKPGWEPIVLARKPLSEPTIAANVLRWGTGALNIDRCRIEPTGERLGGGAEKWTRHEHEGWHRPWMDDPEHQARKAQWTREAVAKATQLGRWPANVVLSHTSGCVLRGVKRVPGNEITLHRPPETYRTRQGDFLRALPAGGRGYAEPDGWETLEDWACAAECPIAQLDGTVGLLHGAGNKRLLRDLSEQERARKPGGLIFPEISEAAPSMIYDRGGFASRFFYCAKADRAEREIGLETWPEAPGDRTMGARRGPIPRCPTHGATFPSGSTTYTCGDLLQYTDEMKRRTVLNAHPTVKPIELMRWLCRLITPRGGLILDPFAGSGSTGIAALREGFRFLGIEREPRWVAIARARIVGDAPLLNAEGLP